MVPITSIRMSVLPSPLMTGETELKPRPCSTHRSPGDVKKGLEALMVKAWLPAHQHVVAFVAVEVVGTVPQRNDMTVIGAC